MRQRVLPYRFRGRSDERSYPDSGGNNTGEQQERRAFISFAGQKAETRCAAARDLAEAGARDILISDYAPSALLMAAFRLADVPAIGGLSCAIRTTKTPVEATRVDDRGAIRPSLRDDLLRVCDRR
jgi:hypothetical protein